MNNIKILTLFTVLFFFGYESYSEQGSIINNLISRGNSLVDKGDLDNAITTYKEVIKIDPNNARGYFMIGYAFGKKDDYNRAIENLSNSIKIDPQKAMAYALRGAAWKHKKEYSQALSDYKKAIELEQEFEAAYNAKAWILATCPDRKFRDGYGAIKLAQKALELNYVAHNLDTLAAAYAETGKFDEAVTIQGMVVEALKNGNNKEILEIAMRRLMFYKSKKPWRSH